MAPVLPARRLMAHNRDGVISLVINRPGVDVLSSLVHRLGQVDVEATFALDPKDADHGLDATLLRPLVEAGHELGLFLTEVERSSMLAGVAVIERLAPGQVISSLTSAARQAPQGIALDRSSSLYALCLADDRLNGRVLDCSALSTLSSAADALATTIEVARTQKRWLIIRHDMAKDAGDASLNKALELIASARSRGVKVAPLRNALARVSHYLPADA